MESIEDRTEISKETPITLSSSINNWIVEIHELIEQEKRWTVGFKNMFDAPTLARLVLRDAGILTLRHAAWLTSNSCTRCAAHACSPHEMCKHHTSCLQASSRVITSW